MRVYIPYWRWEDWVNGMWRKLSNDKEEYYLSLAIKFTGNNVEYGKAMMEVVNNWPNTMLNNLTNTSINKLAFVGHCACCYKHNIPEYIVRLAWRELSEKQRELANNEAKKAVSYWINDRLENEKENRGIRKDMGKQMLFRWDS